MKQQARIHHRNSAFLLSTAVFSAILLGSLAFMAVAEPLSLEAGFAHPPQQARPLTWWHWINGNITKQGIRADLEDMKRVGIGGVQMLDVSIYLPPGPIRYGTDAWHEHVQYAIRTAAELGLEFNIMNCPGWSASGGPWNTPERSMKQFTWSEVEAEGGQSVTLVLPKPPAKLDFYRDVAVLAVPWNKSASQFISKRKGLPQLQSVTPNKLDETAPPIGPEQVLDLTKSMDTRGTLEHTLPPGRWTIIRFGFTTTGAMNHPAVDEGHGLEIDKFDAAAVAFQFDRALGRIIREAGPLAGKTLNGVLFDSFEGGFQNWTDTFPEQFRELKGYAITPLLPVLTGRVVGSREESEAFLRDFRSVVNSLLARNYFGTMQRLAHQHGLKVYAEAQGGPLNPVLCNEFTDVPMNEFWMPDAAPRFHMMKQIASVANVMGRSVVGAESFTAKPEDGRWLATPATMKMPGDCAFAAGINRFIFHTYVHQSYEGIAPGFTLGRYGTHFGRLNTWWPFAGEWMAYLSRCQFLLQQGRTVADICLLSNEHLGDLLPAGALKVPAGYDFDTLYPQQLVRMTWKDGAFHLPQGAAYRVLVLPDRWVADMATLRRLKEFADARARIVGALPAMPAGLREMREQGAAWRELIKALQARQIPPRESLESVLKTAGIGPDVAVADARVRAIHRVTGEGDLYFLSNQSPDAITFQADFRAGKRAPELWDPVTGRIQEVDRFEARGGRVIVPLRLEASGSVFVVFRRALLATMPAAKAPVANAPAPVAIEGPWEVRFQQGRGAPDRIQMEKLIPWNSHVDPGVKYFSGIATYLANFKLPADYKPAGQRCLLHLGKVCDVAEVKINGRCAGVAWTAPFALDVTEHLRPGANTLEIAVANRWVNRIIGDEALPPDAQYSNAGSKFTIGRLAELPEWLGDPRALRQRQRFTFATWHFYEKDSPLLDSGLLGPVRLEFPDMKTFAPEK